MWIRAQQPEPVQKRVMEEDVEQLLTSNKPSEKALTSLNDKSAYLVVGVFTLTTICLW